MKKIDEMTPAELMKLSWLIITAGLAVFFAVTLAAANFMEEGATQITIIVTAIILLVVLCIYALNLERKAGCFECSRCHHMQIPSLTKMTLAPHIGRTRYMKCPKCGKRSWQKFVIWN